MRTYPNLKSLMRPSSPWRSWPRRARPSWLLLKKKWTWPWRRRTLREARERQHQVRLSRRYYKSSSKNGFKGDGKGKFTSASSTTWLRCGGDGKTANCPRATANCHGKQHWQQCPLCLLCRWGHSWVCLGQLPGREQRWDSMCGPATIHARGGGARQSSLGWRGHSHHRLSPCIGEAHGLESHEEHVDTTERPTFGFGNSTRNQCLSTAAFKIKADVRSGQLQIHTLDHGDGPVLFSIASLRALGAIIDFSEDLVVFRQLSDKKIIPLERSSTGHQLLPLTSDWYENAKEASHSVPSLRSFI